MVGFNLVKGVLDQYRVIERPGRADLNITLERCITME